MRVCGRFIFQNGPENRKSIPDDAQHIPKVGYTEVGFARALKASLNARETDRPLRLSKTHRRCRSHDDGINFEPDIDVPDGRQKCPRPCRQISCLRERSRPLQSARLPSGCGSTSLGSLSNFSNYRPGAPARRRGGRARHEVVVPARRRPVERQSIAVADLNGLPTDDKSRSPTVPRWSRLGEHGIAGTDAFVGRVAVDVIPLGNVEHGVVGFGKRVAAVADVLHPLRAPQFAVACLHSRLRAESDEHSTRDETYRNRHATWIDFAANKYSNSAPASDRVTPILPRLGLGVRVANVFRFRKLIVNHSTLTMRDTPPLPTEPNIADCGMGSLLLSRVELNELTGTKQAARQRRWFDERGWPYAVPIGRNGHPRVSRKVFEDRMRQSDPTATRREPCFDALDHLGRRP